MFSIPSIVSSTSSTSPASSSYNYNSVGCSFKSKSIPIRDTGSNEFGRTLSEDQLYLDEAIADNRDYRFCCRVVAGISKSIEDMSSSSSSSFSENPRYIDESRECLNHIISTRNNSDSVGGVRDDWDVVDGWSTGLCIDDDDDHEEGSLTGTSELASDPLMTSIGWLTASATTSPPGRDVYHNSHHQTYCDEEDGDGWSYDEDIIFDMDDI